MILCDLKFRPAKENAAASELDGVFVKADWLDVILDKLVVEVLADGCRRCTESCKEFANAFSCWRMN